MNKVMMIGRLTRDPERKDINTSIITNFSIAINEKFKNRQDEWVDRVHYIDCVTFGTTAENIATYCHKGDQVAIEGSLSQERWQDATTQQNRSKVVVKVARVQFLTPKGTNGHATNNAPVVNEYGEVVEEGDPTLAPVQQTPQAAQPAVAPAPRPAPAKPVARRANAPAQRTPTRKPAPQTVPPDDLSDGGYDDGSGEGSNIPF